MKDINNNKALTLDDARRIFNEDNQEALEHIESIKDTNPELYEYFSKYLNVVGKRLNILIDDKETRDHNNAKLLKYLFGPKADKVKKETDSVTDVADELETIVKEDEELPEKRKYSRKSDTNIKLDVSGLKSVEVTVEVAEDKWVCPQCNESMVDDGVKEFAQLEYQPGHFYVKNVTLKKVCCKKCSDLNGNPLKVRANYPFLNEFSYVTASLLAYFATSKYILHMPIDRLVKKHNREGLNISKSVIGKGLLNSTETYLMPLYQRMLEDYRGAEVKYCDETNVKLVNKKGNSAFFVASCKESNHIVLYIIGPAATKEKFLEIAGNNKCYLHCDGKNIYEDHEHVTIVSCFAHARRKFVDIKNNPISIEAVRLIKEIYEANELIVNEHHGNYNVISRERISKVKILIDNYFSYIRQSLEGLSERSPLANAIRYSLNREKGLREFLYDGRLEIDNNHSERMVKYIVQGRKNWITLNNVESAEISGVLYSLLQTAMMNKINPYEYIKHLFTIMPSMNSKEYASTINSLLPYSQEMKEKFKFSN